MNRFEFYSKINLYKGKQHLAHSNGSEDYDYYTKIDNYYKDGTARYFYTKESWDAYQKNLQLSDQAKEKEKLDKQRKEQYEKNKAASEHEVDRYGKKTNDTANYEKQINKMFNGDVKTAQSGRESAIKKSQQNEQALKDRKDSYEKNKNAEEAQNKQKQDSSMMVMKKDHPELFNSKNQYVEPVKDIFAELNSSSKDRSRIYQTSLVEFLWTLGDRNYRDEYDDDNVKTRWNKYKERVFNDVDEIYNKEDAEKIKELINNLEDDQRNIVKYMKNAKEDDYYKNKLKTDNMHKMLADAINRQKVDDREFRSEDAAVKYALNQIEDYIMHVYYDFIDKDAKAKDFYNRYEPNIIGKNDELGFRKDLLKRLKYEVKKEILESFPKEVAKKYLPDEKDFWK